MVVENCILKKWNGDRNLFDQSVGLGNLKRLVGSIGEQPMRLINVLIVAIVCCIEKMIVMRMMR